MQEVHLPHLHNDSLKAMDLQKFLQKTENFQTVANVFKQFLSLQQQASHFLAALSL